jgi:protein-S-isoprenylcysteine O-methyltransferase
MQQNNNNNNNNNNYSRRTQSNNAKLFSVLLSLWPICAIFFIIVIIDAILYKADSQMGIVLYLFIISCLFVTGNIIAFVVLWPIMNFSIYWRSSLLSNVFLIGILISNQRTYPSLVCFGYYLMSLSFFHLSEYTFTALFNQEETSTDSFLLNHSWEYGIAAASSWCEFLIEAFLFPSLKLSLYTRLVGIFFILFGELFRKSAMYTAGTNFNHYVQESKQENHILVTSGVYAFFRHPSYFGWFVWSIGTQILLANPICTVLYTIVSWKFFNSRIVYEEYYLLKFFGKQYLNYQEKVSSGNIKKNDSNFEL